MFAYKTVLEKLINEMEQGRLPWTRPWFAGQPMNGATGRKYRGFNRLSLLISNAFGDPRYMTFKQVNELGGYVKKGSKATPIIGWFEDKQSEDEAEEIVHLTTTSESNGVKLEITSHSRLKPRRFFVFNIEQTEGLQLPELVNHIQKTSPQAALDFAVATGAEIRFAGNSAFYVPQGDYIQVPQQKHFYDSDGFIATLFHELTHWTGHSSRLARTYGSFGSDDYAKEELVAELAASFLCNDFGVTSQVQHNAAYLQDWLRVLDKDPNFLVYAAQKAEKAIDYLKQTVEIAP